MFFLYCFSTFLFLGCTGQFLKKTQAYWSIFLEQPWVKDFRKRPYIHIYIQLVCLLCFTIFQIEWGRAMAKHVEKQRIKSDDC